jgi:translation initiation factor 2 alpha subunit (eIF-2alpha)
MEKYQEGDIILCKVKNIDRTTVFVETLDGENGSIVLSEIAPGRIRNLRDYVVPNKIIACKILSIRDKHIFLSFRRVKTDERKKLMEQYKKETTFHSVLKKICGESCAQDIIKEIKKQSSLIDFFEDAKENKSLLKKHFKEKEIEQILKVIESKKEKDKILKKEFKIFCTLPNGVNIIKDILKNNENITYLGSSKFQIKIISSDLKKASQEISNLLEEIEKQAKKNKCEFEVRK